MERFSARTIDEVGMMVLPSELREKLSLKTGDEVFLQVVDTIVIMRREKTEHSGFTCKVDDLGRIKLSAELRGEMGWNIADKIAPYNTDNLIILKAA